MNVLNLSAAKFLSGEDETTPPPPPRSSSTGTRVIRAVRVHNRPLGLFIDFNCFDCLDISSPFARRFETTDRQLLSSGFLPLSFSLFLLLVVVVVVAEIYAGGEVPWWGHRDGMESFFLLGGGRRPGRGGREEWEWIRMV